MSSVLLLHAGIADSRMWQPQVEALEAAGHRVVAPDLRGFGERRLEPAPFSHLRDAEALLDGPAAVVGCSLGGRVALELAVHRPDLVERLRGDRSGLPRLGVVRRDARRVGRGRGGVRGRRLRERGRGERSPVGRRAEPFAGDVDPDVRAAATEMVLRSYEMQDGAWESGADEEDVLDPPIGGRLGEIRCPTLVLVGDEDVSDMQAIAAHVAGSIEGARLVTIANTAHLPSLERPDEVNALLLSFLGDA